MKFAQPENLYRVALLLFCIAAALLAPSCASTSEAGTDVQLLQQELESARQQISDLETELESLQTIINASVEEAAIESPRDLPEAISQLKRLNQNSAEANEQVQSLESELAKARERIATLSDALSQAQFAQSLFTTDSNDGSPDQSNQTGQEGQTDPAEEINQGDEGIENPQVDVDSVFSPDSIARTNSVAVGGSNLVSQNRIGGGSTFISHTDYGHFSPEPAYLEIQRSSGNGLELFLVLQHIENPQAENFGLFGGDLSLAGAFLISLTDYEYREILEDANRRLERIYIGVDSNILRALGRMANEQRGEIILKGLYGERQVLINRELASAFREVLSAFLELSRA